MITLTEGDYASGDALAAEIEARINADSALISGGASVSVAYDATSRRFTVTSANKGSTSAVAVHHRCGRCRHGARPSLSAAARRDATAATVADAAGGISLLIRGGALGDRGTVTLVRGVMNRVDQALNDALSIGGLFANKQVEPRCAGERPCGRQKQRSTRA